MDIFEAINTRYSVKKVKADSLPRDVIEKLLDAGNRAPNHYKVRPWRFFVLTGNGRNKLGDVMAASQHDRQPDVPPEGLDKTRALPLRAPVVIAVGVDKPVETKVLELENYAAASAACQNILLAAHALGLGRDLAYRRLVTGCKSERVFWFGSRPTHCWVYLCWLILKSQASLLRVHPLKIEQCGWSKWIAVI